MPLRVLVGEKQLAETSYNVALFPDKPNEFAKYISRHETISSYSCNRAYVAVESRGKSKLQCREVGERPSLFVVPNRPIVNAMEMNL